MRALHSLSRSHDRRNAGFTLTEIVIVLGVIGIVLGGLWAAYSQVYLNNQVRTTSQQVVAIAQNIRAIFAEQGSVTGNNDSNINLALDQLRAFPLNMRQGQSPSGVIFNIWNAGTYVIGNLATTYTTGSVQVFADDCTGNESLATPQPCFGINYLDVPQSACVKLLTQTGQTGMGLQRIIVNASVIGDATNAPLFPIISSGANIGCNNANPHASNTILWIYLLKDNKS